MNHYPQSVKVDGPFTHSNLSLYLLTLPPKETQTSSQYFLPLHRAIAEKSVVVHETGNVGNILVQNLSPDLDIFIQDGDIVQGGRQDRVVRVDFIVPANSGPLPLPTFCVEKRRWGRRGAESVQQFSGCGKMFAARLIRAEMRSGKTNQHMLWDEVSKMQSKLSASVGEDVAAASSPSSVDLSLGHKALERRREAVRQELGCLREKYPQATGMLMAVNGKVLGGDLYFTSQLFGDLWSKLLDTAANESVGELMSFTKAKLDHLPTAEKLTEILAASISVEEEQLKELPPRTRITLRRGQGKRVFTTRDVGNENEAVRAAFEFLQA